MAELTIITTRPERALVTLFGQPRAPEGVAVVTTTHGVGSIPNGSRCFAVWFEPRKYRSAVEWAWIMRRERGGVVGLAIDELRTFGIFDARGGPVPPVTSMRQRGQEVRL